MPPTLPFQKLLFRLVVLFGITFLPFNLFGQGVAINSNGDDADNSAMLDVESTTQGMLVPRMTQAQRNVITNPAASLIIYQTDNTPGFYYNAGTPGSPNWVILLNGAVSAGGDLSGTYPSPTITNSAATGGRIITSINSASSGTINSGRLGTGTANSTTFLRGDNTWVAPSGSIGQTFTFNGVNPETALSLFASFGSHIQDTWGNTDFNRKAVIMPVACTFDAIYIFGNMYGGSGSNTITFTLYVNGSPTSLSTSISPNSVGNNFTGSNTGTTVAVNAGDRVALHFAQTNDAPFVQMGVSLHAR